MSTASGGSAALSPPSSSPQLSSSPSPSPSSSPSTATRTRSSSTDADSDNNGAPRYNIPKFSPELERALKQVCPSDDPLDAADFDPIQYINATFPDESSIMGGKLDSFLLNLRRKVSTLQDSIRRDVREQSVGRTQTSHAIHEAQQHILQLFGQIGRIKEKATASEQMVADICRDIRSLDTAKRHLTNTLRALRNLHMLVSAVGQLDAMVAERQWRLAAERLQAINDLFSLFEQYGDVPKIVSLKQSVNNTKSILIQQLTADFHRTLPSPLVKEEPQLTNMKDACAVVDVLALASGKDAAAAGADGGNVGAHFKSDLLSWFCNLQLEEYSTMFNPALSTKSSVSKGSASGSGSGSGGEKDPSSLEAVDRRVHWAKTWLRSYEARYSKVFPKYWRVDALVMKEMCKMTKVHLSKVLAANQRNISGANGGGIDTTAVQAMVSALLVLIDFEKYLAARFKPVKTATLGPSPALDPMGAARAAEEEENEYTHEARVEAIKRKYARKTDSEREEEQRALEAEQQALQKAIQAGQRPPTIEFRALITEVFTPYMGVYVEMERRNMEDLIAKFEREENWSNPLGMEDTSSTMSGAATSAAASAVNAVGASSSNQGRAGLADRFGSSNDLFQYIKNSINRCSKLNKNTTLIALFQEYKHGLRLYCQLLESKLPRKPEGQTLNQTEVVLTCFIVNTCEYVVETLPGLASRVSGMIDTPHKNASSDHATSNDSSSFSTSTSTAAADPSSSSSSTATADSSSSSSTSTATSIDLDLDNEVDAFSQTLTHGIQVIVSSIWTKLLVRSLNNMVKMPWSSWTQVGDESAYVTQVASCLREEIPLVARHLSPRYAPFFCNQLASTFIPRYMESIFKCRRIGQMGAQQMSLDAHALKNVLLQVPNLVALSAAQAAGEEKKVKPVQNKSYLKYVNTEMSKAEALLKTLVSPNDRLIVTFKALLPKSSIDDLLKILNLRGLTKRSDQEALIHAYNATVATEDQLKFKQPERTTDKFSLFSQLRAT